MGIISRKTAGWTLLWGFGFILALNILLIKPFFFGLCLSAGLFLAIIFFYQPLWGTGILLVLRPIIDNWGENTSLSITESFSLSLTALLGILASFLFSIFLLKNISFWKKIPFKKSWLLFIALAGGSFFWSLDPASTVREVVRLFSIFLLFSTVFVLSFQAPESKKLIALLLVSAIIPFLSATWQMISQTGLGGTLGLDGRLYGTFSHPNTFASFVLVIIAISWLWFSQEKDLFQKKLFLFFLGLALFFLLETFSRGAWLSFLVFLSVLSIFKSPKIIFGAAALFFLVFSFSEDFRFRLQDVWNPSSTSSIQWRIEQWTRGLTSWEKRPWQGWGAGTETVVFENQYGFYTGNPYTHNDFLRAGIENGILGFGAFILLIGTPLVCLLLAIRKTSSPSVRMTLIFALAIFLTETIFSLSSNLFRATAIQWVLWSFLGIVLAREKFRQN